MGKTALVLSAGGMFGAYQAGVWSEIASCFDPEIVVGASAGSLNGWMIACNRSSGELVDRWLHLEEASNLRFRVPRSFAGGVVDSSLLEAEIRRLAGLRPLRQFGVVLSRLPSLQPELFRTPAVDWVHIAASCAVPGVLRTHSIGGTHYADGGILDPLPLWAAVDMGATRIVTVNLLNHRPWTIRALVGALRLYARYRPVVPATVQVVDISPAGGLGGIRDSAIWRRESAERWIEEGRADAIRARQRVVELTASAHLPHLSDERTPPAELPVGSARHRHLDG